MYTESAVAAAEGISAVSFLVIFCCNMYIKVQGYILSDNVAHVWASKACFGTEILPGTAVILKYLEKCGFYLKDG